MSSNRIDRRRLEAALVEEGERRRQQLLLLGATARLARHTRQVERVV